MASVWMNMAASEKRFWNSSKIVDWPQKASSSSQAGTKSFGGVGAAPVDYLAVFSPHLAAHAFFDVGENRRIERLERI